MTRLGRWLQLLLAMAFLGTAFQPGAGCLGKVAQNVNPCGTILNCDPLEYDLLFWDGQPNFATDPTCTIPGFCGGTPFPPTNGDIIAPPPSDSGFGGSGTVDTTTTTGT